MNVKLATTQRVVDMIAECGGNKSEAALRLKMTRSNVQHHIRRAQAAGVTVVTRAHAADMTQRVVDMIAQCGGNQSEAARRLGVSRGAILHHVHAAKSRGLVAAPTKTLDSEVLRRALIKGTSFVDFLAKQFGVDVDVVETGLAKLSEAGYAVRRAGAVVWIDRDSLARPRDEKHTYSSRDDGSFVFGFTSDNHLGSKYSREDVLAQLFDRFASVGVDRVFNAGNYIDGEARFNKHDLLVHGMHAQAKFLAERWPRLDGVATYAVSGDDHEGWYAQREGIDIGRYVEMVMRDAGRDDWVDLGYMESDIRLVHAKSGAENRLRVAHPGGGSSYATSYAPQKYIESLQGGDKPGACLLGHYHKLHCINIRGVWVIQTGCTQDQTPFGRKLKLDFQVGGGICRLQMDPATGALTSCTVELIQFFNREFYGTGRWSHARGVAMPDRTVEY
jgi:transposase